MSKKESKGKLNILFLTLLDFEDFNQRNIYTDLINEFIENGHNVFVVSPVEKKNWVNFKIIKAANYMIVKPKIGNYQKTNILEKGISVVTLEKFFINAIKKHYCDVVFDLILYSTPPVTFANAVSFVKKRDGATSYLLLKDIFPQNSVDLGILSKKGIKGFIYKYFRYKEVKLYKKSDFIGCMSDANKEYILKNNRFVTDEMIEVNPNSEKNDLLAVNDNGRNLRSFFGIPSNKKIFIYGGNLGKPQGVDFILKCIGDNEKREDVFFAIFGSGTEYNKIQNYITSNDIRNASIHTQQEKEVFEKLVALADVGMIFLDYRFTIPNFPSRLLTYMKQKKPVLITSDPITDIGKIAKENNFGDYCYSNNLEEFGKLVINFKENYDLKLMGNRAYDYFLANYTVEETYKKIMRKYGSEIK